MNDQIVGIVIAFKEYREHDAMLHILSEDGLIYTMIAKGVQKIKSKNASGCQLFTKSRFQCTIRETSDLHALRSAEILDSYRHIRDDLYKQSIASYMCECIQQSAFEDNPYELLETSLNIVKDTKHPLRILCLFQSIVNRMHGIEPFVDGCVLCGSQQNILAISIQHGGLICSECFQTSRDEKKISVELKRFRMFCKAELKHYELLKPYQDVVFSDFLSLYEFLSEYAGVRVRSIRFLKHLYNMEGDL